MSLMTFLLVAGAPLIDGGGRQFISGLIRYIISSGEYSKSIVDNFSLIETLNLKYIYLGYYVVLTLSSESGIATTRTSPNWKKTYGKRTESSGASRKQIK